MALLDLLRWLGSGHAKNILHRQLLYRERRVSHVFWLSLSLDLT